MDFHDTSSPIHPPTRNAIASNPEAVLVGIRVLLVEDEVDIAELLITLLAGVGAKVAWVAQAEEALTGLTQVAPNILIEQCEVTLA
ncbi:MAG: hypothetical protein KME12_26460 [Trichocoleus desertorum ATA4-8-CV12]|jgi:PleD family two-component response regulator|nr:hypothetical protein [Trichocoleus desertorum ATA4-8-CV12]